jgi:hypothetical protein
MRRLKTPALLTIAVGAVAATAFAAAPATAAAECEITGTPASVTVGIDTTYGDLTPTTNCPDGSKVEFNFQAGWPEGVPFAWQGYSVQMTTYTNGNPKALGRDDARYPFPVTIAGNVLAGQPFDVGYTAFVDTGTANFRDGETTFAYATTLKVLRATQVSEANPDRTTIDAGESVEFTPTVQRADWDTRSWREFNPGWLGFDVQFKADGTDEWVTTAEKVGGWSAVSGSPETSGDFRIRYRGDVVSAVSYSDPVHITVT